MAGQECAEFFISHKLTPQLRAAGAARGFSQDPNPGELNHEVCKECKEHPADVSAMQHSFPRLLLVSDRYLQIHIKHINL